MRACLKCGEENIRRNKTYCRICMRAYHAEWRKMNPDKTRANGRKSARLWRLRHPDQARENEKRWRERNRNKKVLQQRKYYAKAMMDPIRRMTILAKNRERTRAWRKNHAETRRNKRYLKKYGIPYSQYESMYIGQGGLCAICANMPDNGRLVVDHDHSSGRVRSLLCVRCNLGLGHFLDDVQRIELARLYLVKHAQEKLRIVRLEKS